MLKLDKKTVAEFEDSWVKKLKVFFYEAGCSGTKINMETDFEVEESIDRLESDYGFELYVPKTDREHLEHASITRVVVASFAFEKPVPKVDLEKLRLLRQNFKNKSL